MLHWLAGQKQPEGTVDPDATGLIDAPETPAPVFAVRAFKQAIFGTPQTVQPKPRRHSNTEASRPRHHDNRATRPVMLRPKSASDAQALGKNDGAAAIPEPIASPTKGILMTPGTAAARRKTVTFGANVPDNEEKKPTKTGLPDDCPGKYPSPWTKAGASNADEEQATDGRKSKTKLTEALEQVRDESAKKRRARRSTTEEHDEMPTDFPEPKSESGRYWKTQYDVYRENTQREVKKLIIKQRSAKNYARDKDARCTELELELEQEKKKVEGFARRTADLEAQLKQLQRELQNSRMSDPQVSLATMTPGSEERREATENLKKGGARSNPPTPATMVRSSDPDPTLYSKFGATEALLQVQPAKAETAETDIEPPAKSRPKIERIQTNDIWAHVTESSTTSPNKVGEATNEKPRGGRMVTSGTGLTPLKSLSINTLPTSKLVRRDSAQPSPPAVASKTPSVARQDSATSPNISGKGDEAVESPDCINIPSPEPKPEVASAPKAPSAQRTNNTATIDAALPLPVLSPSQPRTTTSSPQSQPAKLENPSPVIKDTISRKENVSPDSKANQRATDVKMRPSAAWHAIDAHGAGNRVTSLADKAVKEIGADRLEAAKARQRAKGRNIS